MAASNTASRRTRRCHSKAAGAACKVLSLLALTFFVLASTGSVWYNQDT
jgi:hypothetical protein